MKMKESRKRKSPSRPLLLGVILLALPFVGRADTLQQVYLGIYLKCSQGDSLEQHGEALGARVAFDDALYFLLATKRAYPNWQVSLVDSRIRDCQAKIRELEPPAAQQALNSRASASKLYDEGVHLEAAGRDEFALEKFERDRMVLELIRAHDPEWKPGMVARKDRSPPVPADAGHDACASHWSR
jgi:hypothetical protein